MHQRGTASEGGAAGQGTAAARQMSAMGPSVEPGTPVYADLRLAATQFVESLAHFHGIVQRACLAARRGSRSRSTGCSA